MPVAFSAVADLYDDLRAYSRRPELVDADFDVMFEQVRYELQEPLRGPDQLIYADIDWTPTTGVDANFPDFGWCYKVDMQPVELLHLYVDGCMYSFVPFERYLPQTQREPYQPVCTMGMLQDPLNPALMRAPTTSDFNTEMYITWHPEPVENMAYHLNLGMWASIFQKDDLGAWQVMTSARHLLFQRMMTELMVYLAWDERVPLFKERYIEALGIYNSEGKKVRHQMSKLITTNYESNFDTAPP